MQPGTCLQVRTVTVTVKPIPLSALQVPEPKVTTMKTVEASMRSAPSPCPPKPSCFSLHLTFHRVWEAAPAPVPLTERPCGQAVLLLAAQLVAYMAPQAWWPQVLTAQHVADMTPQLCYPLTHAPQLPHHHRRYLCPTHKPHHNCWGGVVPGGVPTFACDPSHP